jgi:hypothetical protein
MSGQKPRAVPSCRVAVARVEGEYRLLCTTGVAAGRHLLDIDGDLTECPGRHSLQVDDRLHVDVAGEHSTEEFLDRFPWRFMNHSCEPSALVRGRAVFAIRQLDPCEEITFDYNTTEDEIAEPFDCHCGSHRCAGRIRGFRFLTRPDRERLRPRLAPYLLRRLDDEARQDAPLTPAGGRLGSRS